MRGGEGEWDVSTCMLCHVVYATGKEWLAVANAAAIAKKLIVIASWDCTQPHRCAVPGTLQMFLDVQVLSRLGT